MPGSSAAPPVISSKPTPGRARRGRACGGWCCAASPGRAGEIGVPVQAGDRRRASCRNARTAAPPSRRGESRRAAERAPASPASSASSRSGPAPRQRRAKARPARLRSRPASHRRRRSGRIEAGIGRGKPGERAVGRRSSGSTARGRATGARQQLRAAAPPPAAPPPPSRRTSAAPSWNSAASYSASASAGSARMRLDPHQPSARRSAYQRAADPFVQREIALPPGAATRARGSREAQRRRPSPAGSGAGVTAGPVSANAISARRMCQAWVTT